MNEILEGLLRDRCDTESKSYLIGLERGRLWAMDRADYFELRQWSEMSHDDFEDLVLPHDENDHFRIITSETPVQWEAYLRGWISGVREIRQKY